MPEQDLLRRGKDADGRPLKLLQYKMIDLDTWWEKLNIAHELIEEDCAIAQSHATKVCVRILLASDAVRAH
jgi:hypothetical protein